MSDVAPTLAALLGVPAPAHAEGRTLLELLTLGDPELRLQALESADAARAGAGAAARCRWPGKAGTGGAARTGAPWGHPRGAAGGRRGCAPAPGGTAARRGLLSGAVATATAAGLVLVLGGPSFDGFRALEHLAVKTALLALLAAFAALARLLGLAWAGRLAPEQAWRLALGAALGASPLAALAFVLAGVAGPRLTCRPDWVAAGPTLAYIAFAPVLAVAALLPLLAASRGNSATITPTMGKT